MLRPLLLLLLGLVLPACSSSATGDAAMDQRLRDYAKIEGPTTTPVVDLPVTPSADLGPASAQ